jgi:hypothetical protein
MVFSGTLGALDQLVERTDCSLDDLLHALAHERRRSLLEALANGSGEQTLAGVAKRIATEEQTRSTSRGEHYRQVYLDLYHAHVPELEAVGLIGYDQETGNIWLTPAGTELASDIHAIGDHA